MMTSDLTSLLGGSRREGAAIPRPSVFRGAWERLLVAKPNFVEAQSPLCKGIKDFLRAIQSVGNVFVGHPSPFDFGGAPQFEFSVARAANLVALHFDFARQRRRVVADSLPVRVEAVLYFAQHGAVFRLATAAWGSAEGELLPALHFSDSLSGGPERPTFDSLLLRNLRGSNTTHFDCIGHKVKVRLRELRLWPLLTHFFSVFYGAYSVE